MHVVSEQDAHLVCSCCSGIGPVTFSTLMSAYGSAKGIVAASEGDLARSVKPKIAHQLQSIKEIEIIAIRERMQREGIEYIARCEKTFPTPLLHIADPPIGLFVKGAKESLLAYTDRSVAIVGTRRPSAYGQSVTTWIASSLVCRGLLIVSGLAFGIDAVAHRAAVSNNGLTVAVVAGGIDVGFPSTNRRLAEDIVRSGGCLVSEHPPGTRPEPGMFVVRNRLIAGLVKAIVVIEGSKTSGALATARFGAEQGRDVYAVPGQITSPESQAPHILIKEGATPLLAPEDVLGTFAISSVPAIRSSAPREALSISEEMVLTCFQGGAMTLDEVTQQVKGTISDTLSAVSLLEIKGLLEKTQNGMYVRVLS